MVSPRYILALLTLLLLPAASVPFYAQGGSPVQPEYTGQPVPAGPSVNEFTGDFTYGLPILTVPGPNGSSYSLTLSYQAGSSPNADVSWVGYGWSLNPGAIVRNKRGFPDDWDGDITYHNKVPVDYTVTSTDVANLEFGSFDFIDGINVGGSVAIRYNSQTGFGKTWTLNGGIDVMSQSAGVAYANDNGEGEIEPVLSLNLWALGAHLLASGADNSDDKTGNKGTPTTQAAPSFWEKAFNKSVDDYIKRGRTPNVFRKRELDLAPPSAVPLTGKGKTFGHGFTVSGLQGVVSGFDYTWIGHTLEMRPEEQTTLHGYGYLRSGQGLANNSAMMDYYYEKDVPYKVDDRFLPIPFSNADVFSVTGGGSFRAFNRGVSYFRQNQVTSEIDIDNEQFTGIGGASFGVGYRWGDGAIIYDAQAWDNPEAPEYQSFTDQGDEPWFFRFSHDLGGSLLYDNDDRPIRASIENHSGVIGDVIKFLGINDIDQFPRLPNDINLRLQPWERPGRTNYVGFTLHSDLLQQKNDNYYKSYTRDAETRAWVANREAVGNQIGEFALYGPGKSRYVYGLPVFVKQEKALSLGLKNIKFDSAANVHHNLLAYRYIDEATTQTAIGEEVAGPYAAAWLLTLITTPDYIDLTGDGPTDDDLGGWTKFHYTRVRGGNNWRYWRQPFNGLAYNAGDISDPEDDLGGYAEGYAEQYYLDRIETKTHIAQFYQNSTFSAPRKDGYPLLPLLASSAQMAGDSTLSHAFPSSDQPIRYLDQISLYTKNADGNIDSLLSTVHFEYDYSLRPNMPNSLRVHPDSTTRYGMLTLRKVWTEQLNVRNNRIDPVLFGYSYRRSEDYSAAVRARYPDVTSFADNLTEAEENPSYNPYDFDAWGNYRPGGADRLDRRFPYVPQNDTTAWDPAAWQLKWIKSSSGGEMQIQYEEDEYAFVHDRPAMAMVSLKEVVGNGFLEQSFDDNTENKYYLNLSDIGIDPTNYEQVAKVRELIERQSASNGKIFFRFLYALRGDTARIGNPEYNSGYIEGYADLDAVEIEAIDSTTPQQYAIYLQLIGRDNDGDPVDKGLPKTLCWDYVRKRKRGKLGLEQEVPYSSNRAEMVSSLNELYYSFHQEDHCKTIDYAHSYIRIPMITPKKGGGLRVKRLLTYDPGLEGDSALYGTEYHYEIYDQERNQVISSGVATNEPSSIRDENVLIDFLKRDVDDELDAKVIFGSNRARNEGPIGESLLPPASVGYARVATHPLHQGATTVGFGVTDFYTYRQYPFDARYDSLGSGVDYTDPDLYDYRTLPPFENLLVYHQSEYLVSVTQGYRFILSDMHGKVRRNLSNGGRYSPLESDWVTGAMTEYQYFSPGDSVPLLYRIGDSIRYGYPGKEMEIVHASRKNGSYIHNLQIEGDAGLWFISGRAYYAVENAEIATHVTSKIVTYPAIVKSMTTYADGNYNQVENVAFDPRSGNVLISRARDGFDGLALDQSPGGHTGTYVSYAYPLIDVHPEFERISGNEHAVIQSSESFPIIKGKNGSGRVFLDFPGGSETGWLRKLTPGDLIELTTTDDDDAGRYHVDEIQGNVVWLIASGLYNEGSGDPSLSVLNEPVDIHIIESGRANAPGIVIGTIGTYGETDAEVKTAANFGWSGAEGAARQAFVDQLNAALALGSGTFNASNVDSTLEFRLHTTGDCGTLSSLSKSFALGVSGDKVFIGMPNLSTPDYADTLIGIGWKGRFDLNDAGQIVFRVKGRHDVSQRVLNFTFCGDEPTHRTVAHVINASASGRMNDTIDYDGGGVASIVNEPNAYETGERGRWLPRTSYAYKTDVTHGSRPVAGERIYKDAGVFDDFSLFNWADPESSDMEHWFRLDSIIGINKHAIPYRHVDMLGHPSTMLFDYGQDSTLLPIMTAWNAEEGTIAFESFEPYTKGDFFNHIVDTTAHSGKLSLLVNSNSFTFPLIANAQILDKGLLVRFWMYPLSQSDVKIHLTTTGSPAAFSVTSGHRIARAGEWALYEYHLTGTDLNTLYDPADEFQLWFGQAGSGDTVWVDDIKIQPEDALATGLVYDKKTFRPTAIFGDQHFGAYPQYDAEGKVIRTIVETSRGVKTVAESHVHIPGSTRYWLGEGVPFTLVTGTTIGGETPTTVYNGATDQEQIPQQRQKIDMLHFQFGLDKQELTLFGIEPSRLRDVVQERIGDFNTFSAEEIQLLNRYERLKEEYEELKSRQESPSTPEAKEEIESRLRELEAERDATLEQLERITR